LNAIERDGVLTFEQQSTREILGFSLKETALPLEVHQTIVTALIIGT